MTGYRHIPGAFFPVNPMSVRNVAGLFSINERLVTYLDSDVGRVAVVAVAATGVGWITVAYDRDVRTHRNGNAGRHGWAQRYASPRPLGARRRARHVPPRLDGDPALRAGPRAPRRRVGPDACASASASAAWPTSSGSSPP